MVKKKKEDEIPEWVTDEIQNAKFKKPEELKKSGYILEFYYEDNKIDVQFGATTNSLNTSTSLDIRCDSMRLCAWAVLCVVVCTAST